MEQEEIRRIPGFEDYGVSNLNEVYSYKFGRIRKLRQATGPQGKYKVVGLCQNGVVRFEQVHRLVAVAFLDHPLGVGHNNGTVNHKDWNTHNSRLDNLEIISMRDNCIHGKKRGPKTSQYVGVSLDRGRKREKWLCHIQYKGKNYHLGRFDNEEDAAACYQKNLQDINNGCFWHASFEPNYIPRAGGRKRRNGQVNNQK